MGYGELRNQATAEISTSTIWHVLADGGYHCRVARKVPYLTKMQKRARLAWARQNKDMEFKDWQRVIFSDECYVYLRDKQGHIYVTRCADEVLLDDCLVPTFKQSSVRVMVWVSRFPLALSWISRRTRSCTRCGSTHVTLGVNTRQTHVTFIGIRKMKTTAWQLDAWSSPDQRG
jgi:hypothetical protein